MTTEQFLELKRMGVPGVIRKYLPRIGKTPEEGGISKQEYDQLLRLVAPVVVRETSSVSENTTSTTEDSEGSGTVGTTTASSPRAIRQAVPNMAAQVTFGDGHPVKASGESQKARLLALLQDKELHSTPEIQSKVYGVDHGGICRIASRINDLRNDGYTITSKKISKTIWAYQLQ